MDKRFYKTNPEIDDLIDYSGDNVELVGWSCDDDVFIKNWKFINYKGPSNEYEKRVHLNQINFVDCIFKDVNFTGAVPMHGCFFKRCKFENCILTDHIRWNTFDSCEFDFCLFSGYFHGSTFSKSCKYNNVLLEFYGDDSYFDGCKTNKPGYDAFYNRIISKNTKSRDEILGYFYPNEMLELLRYSIGSKYYFLRSEWTEHVIPDKSIFKSRIIDGKEYFEDVVKEIYIDLNHYKPDIRIVGEYYPLINECVSLIWLRKQKLELIKKSNI